MMPLRVTPDTPTSKVNLWQSSRQERKTGLSTSPLDTTQPATLHLP